MQPTPWKSDFRFLVTIGGIAITLLTMVWQEAQRRATFDMRVIYVDTQLSHLQTQQDDDHKIAQTTTAAIASQLQLIQGLQRELERTIRIEEFYHGPAHPTISHGQ